MLHSDLLRNEGILIVKPDGELQKSDFERLSDIVDPYVNAQGKLHGLMVYVQHFPYWENFQAFVTHIKFVSSHQKYIEKIAVVTDDKVLTVIPSIFKHFIKAEVRQYPYQDKARAMAWLQEGKAQAA